MLTSILIVDDEISWIKTLSNILIDYGFCLDENIYSSTKLSDAYAILRDNYIDIIFLDLNLNNESGQDAIRHVRSEFPNSTLVVMSGVTTGSIPINCMKKGAYDYFPKAMSTDELVLSINKVINSVVNLKNIYGDNVISSEVDVPISFQSYITQDKKIYSIFEYLQVVSMTEHAILITGESGVGKGVLAKAIADYCRPDAPFVSINVAGLDEQMFSDTLFGHTKGAYTNASAQRAGMIAKANNGTLFLDEIGDLPLSQQIKLLYLTQTGEYQKIGSDSIEISNAKIILATNRNLNDLVNLGKFRQDLFYRLNTHHVKIPPLRDRVGDIPLLVRRFVEQASEDYSIDVPHISDGLIELLKDYSYPGNVRELCSIVYDAVLKSDGNMLTFSDFNFPENDCFQENNHQLNDDGQSGLKTLDDLFDEKILDALHLSKGNQSRAASLLGISQSTISRRIKKLSQCK
jgi:DNA-binding NtrC family response regulator